MVEKYCSMCDHRIEPKEIYYENNHEEILCQKCFEAYINKAEPKKDEGVDEE